MTPAALDHLTEYPWLNETGWRHVQRGEQRFTEHLELGWIWPGPTSVLKPWDKEPLIDWGADLERDGVITNAGLVAGAEWDRHRKTDAVNQWGGPVFAAQVEAKLRAMLPPKKGLFWRKRRDKAGDHGKIAHECFQWQSRLRLGEVFPEPDTTPEANRILLPVWEYLETQRIAPIRVEQCVWSNQFQVCGACDYIGSRPSGVGVADLKTGNSVVTAHHVQLAVYSKCVEEMTGVRPQWEEIWHAPANGPFRVIPMGDCTIWIDRKPIPIRLTREELLASFGGLLTAWNYLVRHPEAR